MQWLDRKMEMRELQKYARWLEQYRNCTVMFNPRLRRSCSGEEKMRILAQSDCLFVGFVETIVICEHPSKGRVIVLTCPSGHEDAELNKLFTFYLSTDRLSVMQQHMMSSGEISTEEMKVSHLGANPTSFTFLSNEIGDKSILAYTLPYAISKHMSDQNPNTYGRMFFPFRDIKTGKPEVPIVPATPQLIDGA